jgi:hypothetical protein
MRYKRDQLKLQGDMSESWKKMTDSGVIVDQEEHSLGVQSIVEMAIEVRKQGKPTEGNPFDNGTPPLAPNGMPFMSDQQALMPPPPKVLKRRRCHLVGVTSQLRKCRLRKKSKHLQRRKSRYSTS